MTAETVVVVAVVVVVAGRTVVVAVVVVVVEIAGREPAVQPGSAGTVFETANRDVLI